MNKKIKYICVACLLFGLGVYSGMQFAAGYYRSHNLLDLLEHQTLQSSSYAILFGNDKPEEAKQLILSDLKLNLIKAKNFKDQLSDSMRHRLCSQLLKLESEREAIEHFSSRLSQSGSEISVLLTDIRQCEHW